jgi:hypothetical protein
MVTFDLDDLQSERSYAQQRAAQSKHAVQMFGFELDRRVRAAGVDIRSIVAHPGLGLDGASPRRDEVNGPSTLTGVSARLLSPIARGKNRSAWAAVRAAVDRRRRRRPVLRSGARRHRQTRPRAAAEGEQGPGSTPALVSPLVALLCHESCPVSGETFLSGGRRHARLFVAETEGYVHPDVDLTPEVVAEHWAQIMNESVYYVRPRSPRRASSPPGSVPRRRACGPSSR